LTVNTAKLEQAETITGEVPNACVPNRLTACRSVCPIIIPNLVAASAQLCPLLIDKFPASKFIF
jgi:hypothetical protein